MGRVKDELLTKFNYSGGTKHDSGKPDISLIPYAALVEEAKAFEFGRVKYGRYNFMKGFEATRLAAAALRHITQYLWVSTYDEESGVHHLGHARACLAMILALEDSGGLTDDRYKEAQREYNDTADRTVSHSPLQ